MKLTKSQKAALEWLSQRNGEGTFCKWPEHCVLIAGGDRAPFTRGTWNGLRDGGYVEIKDRRVKVTPLGSRDNGRS